MLKGRPLAVDDPSGCKTGFAPKTSLDKDERRAKKKFLSAMSYGLICRLLT